MSLPQSVQAQAAAAAKHFDREPENPDANKAKAPGREQNPPRDAEKPDTDKPDTQSAEPPKDEPKAEPKTEAKDALYWEHRFNVIRGKYDTEVPALRKENEQLKQQLADASKAPDAPKQSLPGVSDEELARYKEEYGDDLVSLMMRLSGSQQQQPNTEIAQRLERLESEKQEDAEARFWIGLEQAVPNYREINSEPGFMQFLSTFNPQTGRQYQQALSQAQQSLDAKGVADVFKLYLNQAKPTQQQRKVPDEQVEPRTTKAAPTPSSQGGKLWTGADITQFYRDKTAGRYSADEAQRLEADIFAAQREGRVR